MAEVASEETLTSSLGLLLNLGKALLQNAKQEAAESLERFVPHKITTLLGLISVGTQFYKSLGVKKKSEAEAVWQKYYRCEAVREQVEDLLKLQTEWDSFLEDVDRSVQTADIQTAEHLSPELELSDGRTGRSATLADYVDEGQKLLLVLIRHFAWLPWRDHVTELQASQAVLAARSLRVLVVSFGSLEGAQIWLEQTGCTFDMVLDPQTKVYRSFGLGSSYADVMRFDCLLRYSEYEAADRNFPDFPSSLLGNIYQMGGDFLLDHAGKVLFSHRCATPLDRPTVEDILQAADATEH